MKRFLLIFLSGVIIFQFLQALFYQQDFFLKKYDTAYWKDRYEHSQYSLPLSKRLIGDDGLYAYSGYRVIKGDNPTTISVDKPPVAKYLIGLSILFFNSPAYYAFIVSILSAAAFYFLSKKILKRTVLALLATTLLVLDPLFISQTATPWIDIPQLLFLLLNILLFWTSIERKNKLFLLLSGISLGLYIETKPPIALIPLLAFETYLLVDFRKKKESIISIVSFYLALAFGIFLPYFRLFMLGGSLIDVIKYQKFMLVYNLISTVIVDHLAIFKAFFLGHMTEVGGKQIISVSEWNLLWPVAGIISIPFSIYTLIKGKSIYAKFISSCLLFSLLVFSVILFYPRYLLTVIPFMYVLLVLFLSRFEKSLPKAFSILIIIVISFYGLLSSQTRLTPKLSDSLNNFTYSYSKMYFADIYEELLTKSSQSKISREKFFVTNARALSDIGVEDISVKIINQSKKSDDEIKVNAEINYKTSYLGQFSETKLLIFKKENQQWKLEWNWDYLIKDFRPGFSLAQHIITGKRGTIFTKTGLPAVIDKEGLLLSINPALIDGTKENKMLTKISEFTKVGELSMQNRYNENPMPGVFIPIATLSVDVSPDIKELKFPGVKLSPQITRIYNGNIVDPHSISNTSFIECCSRIYSSTNYHGISGVEKDFDKVLSGNNGGELLLKDEKGNNVRVIKQAEAKNGTSVIF